MPQNPRGVFVTLQIDRTDPRHLIGTIKEIPGIVVSCETDEGLVEEAMTSIGVLVSRLWSIPGHYLKVPKLKPISVTSDKYKIQIL